MDHNPTCDNLPHIPRWGLTQGSRMDDLDNCHVFYSLSLPSAERLFQKNRNRFDLLDEHVQSVRRSILRKKGLLWKVADGEEKLAKEKQLNADRQKDWTAACERSNRELKAARDEVVKVKAEKAKESQEYERLFAARKRRKLSRRRILLPWRKLLKSRSLRIRR
ncbi:hypothetical protein Hanom_Chr03g00243691 [Helianthus anomalus]